MKWLLIIGLLILSSCFEKKVEEVDIQLPGKGEHIHTETWYTCPMHPQIKEKSPGKCPICHMNLVKVEVEKKSDGGATTEKKVEEEGPSVWVCRDYPDLESEKEDLCPIDGTPMIRKKSGEIKGLGVVAKVRLRKAQMKHFKPDFFPVTTMRMEKKVRLLGTIVQSEERESNIPARIGGRVEKVFVKSTGSYIKKGDPVLKLYSPKLITGGDEYILARRSYEKSKKKEYLDLLRQSESRLELWGVPKFQMERWYKNKSVPNSITIYSPVSGIVRNRRAVTGKYFNEGQNFFDLADLSNIWVEMDVYEQDASLIALGQDVELTFTGHPGDSFHGKIDFVSPVLNPKTRTLKVRTTIENADGKLKPGMVGDARVTLRMDEEPLVVPRSAVIDTGKRKVVWVKTTDNEFRAQSIRTGVESEGYIAVKDGLEFGDQVVIEGNFLLDAQAQLFGGYEEHQGM